MDLSIFPLETFRNLCSFLYTGDMDRLLRRLAGGSVRDLTITEPDLEEIFLHYYEKGGQEA